MIKHTSDKENKQELILKFNTLVDIALDVFSEKESITEKNSKEIFLFAEYVKTMFKISLIEKK